MGNQCSDRFSSSSPRSGAGLESSAATELATDVSASQRAALDAGGFGTSAAPPLTAEREATERDVALTVGSSVVSSVVSPTGSSQMLTPPVPNPKSSKALRGNALLAACLQEDSDDASSIDSSRFFDVASSDRVLEEEGGWNGEGTEEREERELPGFVDGVLTGEGVDKGGAPTGAIIRVSTGGVVKKFKSPCPVLSALSGLSKSGLIKSGLSKSPLASRAKSPLTSPSATWRKKKGTAFKFEVVKPTEGAKTEGGGNEQERWRMPAVAGVNPPGPISSPEGLLPGTRRTRSTIGAPVGAQVGAPGPPERRPEGHPGGRRGSAGGSGRGAKFAAKFAHSNRLLIPSVPSVPSAQPGVPSTQPVADRGPAGTFAVNFPGTSSPPPVSVTAALACSDPAAAAGNAGKSKALKGKALLIACAPEEQGSDGGGEGDR